MRLIAKRSTYLVKEWGKDPETLSLTKKSLCPPGTRLSGYRALLLSFLSQENSSNENLLHEEAGYKAFDLAPPDAGIWFLKEEDWIIREENNWQKNDNHTETALSQQIHRLEALSTAAPNYEVADLVFAKKQQDPLQVCPHIYPSILYLRWLTKVTQRLGFSEEKLSKAVRNGAFPYSPASHDLAIKDIAGFDTTWRTDGNLLLLLKLLQKKMPVPVDFCHFGQERARLGGRSVLVHAIDAPRGLALTAEELEKGSYESIKLRFFSSPVDHETSISINEFRDRWGGGYRTLLTKLSWAIGLNQRT